MSYKKKKLYEDRIYFQLSSDKVTSLNVSRLDNMVNFHIRLKSRTTAGAIQKVCYTTSYEKLGDCNDVHVHVPLSALLRGEKKIIQLTGHKKDSHTMPHHTRNMRPCSLMISGNFYAAQSSMKHLICTHPKKKEK